MIIGLSQVLNRESDRENIVNKAGDMAQWHNGQYLCARYWVQVLALSCQDKRIDPH